MTVEEVPAQAGLEIALGLEHRQAGNDTLERCFRFLDQAELSFDLKDEIYRRHHRGAPHPRAAGTAQRHGAGPGSVRSAAGDPHRLVIISKSQGAAPCRGRSLFV